MNMTGRYLPGSLYFHYSPTVFLGFPVRGHPLQSFLRCEEFTRSSGDGGVLHVWAPVLKRGWAMQATIGSL